MFSYHPQVLLMQCLSGKVVGLIYLHFDDEIGVLAKRSINDRHSEYALFKFFLDRLVT